MCLLAQECIPGRTRVDVGMEFCFCIKVEMLVLSRFKDEDILIGDDIVVRILDIRGDKVRLGIEAPQTTSVHRREIYEAIQSDKEKRKEQRGE